mmetsp:Transcript_18590/g.44711  ORF Transcript_18590/g.44711 Transcript_18590/m.44711 type:complete len:89 (+) Transcript_18590:940-1206(+)
MHFACSEEGSLCTAYDNDDEGGESNRDMWLEIEKQECIPTNHCCTRWYIPFHALQMKGYIAVIPSAVSRCSWFISVKAAYSAISLNSL